MEYFIRIIFSFIRDSLTCSLKEAVNCSVYKRVIIKWKYMLIGPTFFQSHLINTATQPPRLPLSLSLSLENFSTGIRAKSTPLTSLFWGRECTFTFLFLWPKSGSRIEPLQFSSRRVTKWTASHLKAG